ncbi:MAG: hypothetical protein GC192_11685 [Bacteroidetes bacterium]|nr:hypothetical protein [Bacteroidota bacterium]
MKYTIIFLVAMLSCQLNAQIEIIHVPSNKPNEVIPPPQREYDNATMKKMEYQKNEEKYLKDSLRLCSEFQHIKKFHKCRNRFGKFGFADIKHQMVIPFDYDYIQDDFAPLMIVGQKKKYGVINDKGKQVIPLEYESVAYGAVNKYFIGYKGQKRYAIDLKGKLIIPENITLDDEYLGIIAYDTLSKHYIRYNLKGKKIGSYNCRFSGHLSSDRWNTLEDYLIEGRKVYANGVADSLCRTIVPAKFSFLDWINKDWAYLYNYDGKTRTLYDIKNQKEHVLNFSNILEPVSNDNFIFYNQKGYNKYYGLMNGQLEIVIPPQYNLFQTIKRSNFFVVKTSNEHYGIVDYKGELVLDTIYSYALPSVLEKRKVIKGELVFKYDSTGYVTLGQKIDDSIWLKYGLWHVSKGLIHQPIYDDLYVLSDSAYVTRKDELIEVHSFDGKVYASYYGKFLRLDKLLIETKKKPKTYLVFDDSGNEKAELPNLMTLSIDNKYYVIKNDDSFALYNIEYNQLTPFKYSSIEPLYKLNTQDLQKFLALSDQKNFESWVAWATLTTDGSVVLLDINGNEERL